jgi:outer membrane PBP1 activator LpoA protein
MFSKFRYFFVFVFLLTLWSCGSAPTKKQTAKAPTIQKIEPEVTESRLTIEQIRENLQQEAVDVDLALNQVEMLIEVADTETAQALLYAIAPFIEESQFDRAKLLLALSSPAYTANIDTDWLLQPSNSDTLESRRQTLLTDAYLRQGQNIEAAAVQAEQHKQDAEIHHQIFAQLTALPDSQLKDIETQHPSLRPHTALVQITRQLGHDDTALATAVQQFEQVYFAHPLTQPLPDSLGAALLLTPTKVNNVSVMLPLSGRFATTGDAIRQGMLAAYFALNAEQEAPKIRFLDTATLTHQELVNQSEGSDWVIGPLLKENIDAVSELLPETTKRLALNRLDPAQYQDLASDVTLQQTAYFGLTPEDEAIQLAEHVSRSGYKRPIVVASKMGASKRMLDAFAANWKRTHKATLAYSGKDSLDIVEFETIDKLSESLADALGVGQSEANAAQIDRLTNRILYDQTRSRQDIDAIIVFANPGEMALINPMVEASISPFRQQVVPVFATSRSIEKSTARNTLRDLENVRFLDAPLLLQPEEWPDITTTLQQIWPNQTANFNRLFAFGYDAFTMLPQLPRLAQLPAYQYPGLSGQLQMTAKGEIKRTLPMAQIQQQTVTMIEE